MWKFFDVINYIQDVNFQFTWSNPGVTSGWLLFDITCHALLKSLYMKNRKELTSIERLVGALECEDIPEIFSTVKIGVLRHFSPKRHNRFYISKDKVGKN